jgi:transglutaminase-like putative cysteine protease
MNRLMWSDGWFAAVLTAILASTPALSVAAAAWSERLEPVPVFAVMSVVVGVGLAWTRLRAIFGILLGLLVGLVVITFVYAWTLPQAALGERVEVFARRVADWLGAAFGGTASTDNLLFAFSMSLIAWSIGFGGGWFVFRRLNPWWAIVPSSAALLLNLSYAPPDLLPLVFLHVLTAFALLINLNSFSRVVRWRTEDVEYGLNQGMGFAVSSAAVAFAILFVAWELPVGAVNRGVAGAWENVAGPWQGIQGTFDRLFASLNPSPLSGKGLSVAQTMAPRGSFELGNEPVMQISGKEPAYWRAATYDRYTGRVMTGSTATSLRLEKSQPLDGQITLDEGRKIVQYTVNMIAPSAGVIYAPDAPLTISLPTVYDYRRDIRDFGLLRPVAPVRKDQKYNVLASISTASVPELRSAGTIYPTWARAYEQLPPNLPDAVRQEAWRVVGDATNAYDAASRLEAYLRTLKYSTHVPVPPADKDWVSFLIFDSKEGYCDYFATAMTVMLRAVGIPARVANGYVTGDFDQQTQSYIVSERHAHTWTEVYFPKYGWVTFEPSANRPEPVRLETPIVPFTPSEIDDVLGSEIYDDGFLDDIDDFDYPYQTPQLPPVQAGPNPFVIVGGAILGILLVLALCLSFLWVRGMAGLPLVARTYGQVVRLASWCGLGPRKAQTPYEYTNELAETVPAVREPLRTVADAYVAGAYGGRTFDGDALGRVRAAGSEIRRILLSSVAGARWQRAVSRRVGDFVGARQAR